MAGPGFDLPHKELTEAEKQKREAERKSYEAAMQDYLNYVKQRYGYSGRDFSKDISGPAIQGNEAFRAQEPVGGLLLGTGFHQGKDKRFGVHFTRNEDQSISFHGYSFDNKLMKLIARTDVTEETVSAYREYAETIAQLAKSQGLQAVELSFQAKGENMTPWKLEVIKQAFKKEGLEMSLDSASMKQVQEWDAKLRGNTENENTNDIKKDLEKYLTVMNKKFHTDFEELYQASYGNQTFGNPKGDKYTIQGLSKFADVKMSDEQVLSWKKEFSLPPKPKSEAEKSDEQKVYEVLNNIKTLEAATKTVADSTKFNPENIADNNDPAVKKLIEEVIKIDVSNADPDDKTKQKVTEIGKQLTELEKKSKELDGRIKDVTEGIDKLNDQLEKAPTDEKGKKELGAVVNVAEKELEARIKLQEALSAEQMSLQKQATVWTNQVNNLGVGVPEKTDFTNRCTAMNMQLTTAGTTLNGAAKDKLNAHRSDVIDTAKENVQAERQQHRNQ